MCRAMAQPVIRRSLTAQARVQARVSGICGGESCTGAGFSLSSLGFTCQNRTIVVLHTQISPDE
jgi:hypothetical protein